ncbi:DUF3823 domain-containing protein [Sphingobacterium alkalisoli]|uniref:DUF3823 domain-containing protein n=1 Tax=Sphingobacterium alkalisoli TaxID=1874115 RepID=A0A4U0H7X9_9SPHI|nr:DUF3823 domain-containing protein [Sphingobacterium alkalisoli]TJY67975.1 DUF3823 domain-containing protein [Sphingobacterium alkalisoli]GGH09956.1 hypothetical protein GCM10011418_08170 [Sphingobacterium alkalisoli]
MKLKFSTTMIAGISLLFVACEYDNFEAPKSVLSGKVMHEGNPVNVRNNGTELQLWQDGFALREPIPVFINQDGAFSAVVFDGEYKLSRKGNAPWLPQASDTIAVTVRGNTQVEVPVTPYYTVTNTSFDRSANTVTGQFIVNRVVANSNVEFVRLYLGKTVLTDQAQHDLNIEGNANGLVYGQPVTISGEIPAGLRNLEFIFARIGVKSSLTGEYNYSPVQRIALK